MQEIAGEVPNRDSRERDTIRQEAEREKFWYLNGEIWASTCFVFNKAFVDKHVEKSIVFQVLYKHHHTFECTRHKIVSRQHGAMEFQAALSVDTRMRKS